jgi:hypothetical protein
MQTVPRSCRPILRENRWAGYVHHPIWASTHHSPTRNRTNHPQLQVDGPPATRNRTTRYSPTRSRHSTHNYRWTWQEQVDRPPPTRNRTNHPRLPHPKSHRPPVLPHPKSPQPPTITGGPGKNRWTDHQPPKIAPPATPPPTIASATGNYRWGCLIRWAGYVHPPKTAPTTTPPT